MYPRSPPPPLSKSTTVATTASSKGGEGEGEGSLTWTAENENRLVYVQGKLREAQAAWSEEQEVWIDEVCSSVVSLLGRLWGGACKEEGLLRFLFVSVLSSCAPRAGPYLERQSRLPTHMPFACGFSSSTRINLLGVLRSGCFARSGIGCLSLL